MTIYKKWKWKLIWCIKFVRFFFSLRKLDVNAVGGRNSYTKSSKYTRARTHTQCTYIYVLTVHRNSQWMWNRAQGKKLHTSCVCISSCVTLHPENRFINHFIMHMGILFTSFFFFFLKNNSIHSIFVNGKKFNAQYNHSLYNGDLSNEIWIMKDYHEKKMDVYWMNISYSRWNGMNIR